MNNESVAVDCRNINYINLIFQFFCFYKRNIKKKFTPNKFEKHVDIYSIFWLNDLLFLLMPSKF